MLAIILKGENLMKYSKHLSAAILVTLSILLTTFTWHTGLQEQ